MNTHKNPKRPDIVLMEFMSATIRFGSDGYLMPGGFVPFAKKFAETTRDLRLDSDLLIGSYERMREITIMYMRAEISAAFQKACNPMTRPADMPAMVIDPHIIAINLERSLLDPACTNGFYNCFSKAPFLRRVLEEAARPEYGVIGTREVREHLDKASTAILTCQRRMSLI